MTPVPGRVSALVPTFNRAHLLGESLASLLGQTRPPDEVIVIDDGSSDATADVVAGFADRVAYIRQDNGGKASALNTGLARATGDRIWIFDDDDIADLHALERLSGALDAAPDAGFAFGRYDNFVDDLDGHRRILPVAPIRYEPADLHCAVLERCFIFQPAMLVRRRCYDAVGPFNTGFVRAQDFEMLNRLSAHATGVFVPHILFHQRQHAERRGTAAEAIDGREIWQRQKRYDAQVLAAVHARQPLGRYLPRPWHDGELDGADRIRALIRRAAVVARRGLWQLGADDLRAAAALAGQHGITGIAPAEAAMLGRVFDETSRDEGRVEADNPLLADVLALPRSRFRSALIAALGWPVFRFVLLAARRGAGREALAHLGLYRQLEPVTILPRHLGRLLSRLGPRLSATG